MQKIVTLNEIKSLLGSNETDAKLRYLSSIAHQQLLDILEIADFGSHSVTDEYVQVLKNSLYLNDYPVDLSASITLKILRDRTTQDSVSYSYNLENDNHVVIPDSEFFRYHDYLVSYTAGYTLKETLKIDDNIGLNGLTLVMEHAGEQTSHTLKDTPSVSTDIQIGASASDTATNIATKISGTASTDTVTLPLGLEFQPNESTITADKYTHTNHNIPYNLKMAVSLLIGGAITDKQKIGGAVEIQVSKKRVKFSDTNSAEMFETLVLSYLDKKRYSYHA